MKKFKLQQNILGHCWRKRFHDGVNVEYYLKKMYTQKKYPISNSIMNRFRCKIIQRKQMEEENKSKEIIESQININVSCIIPSSVLYITKNMSKVSIDRKTKHKFFFFWVKKKKVRRGLWNPLTVSKQDLIFMKYEEQHYFTSGERTRTQDLRRLVHSQQQ